LTTGKPRDTESGHAWFGEEGLEKRRVFHGLLAGLLLDGTAGLAGRGWRSVVTFYEPLAGLLPDPASNIILQYVTIHDEIIPQLGVSG